MQESDELKYWRRFIEGEIDALSKLYLLYVNDLFIYGMKIYPDEDAVKDAIQEVFIQLIKNRDKIQATNNSKVYILKSLRNKIIEELRSKNRKHKINTLVFNFESQIESDVESILIISEEEKYMKEKMTNSLNKLSEHQREAIYLRFTKNYNYEQIAEIMNISISSARTLIYRSIKQIKSIIAVKKQNRNIESNSKIL